MTLSSDLVDELHILLLFDAANTQEGIKVHSTADPASVAATRRLFDKGLLSQPDGGYLTGLGQDAAEHAQTLLTILTSGGTAP